MYTKKEIKDLIETGDKKKPSISIAYHIEAIAKMMFNKQFTKPKKRN